MEPAEYYKIRLEHTIQYTNFASRLIYLVSGALIAGFYFVAEKATTWHGQRYAEVGILLFLAGVNVIHAVLLLAQGRWYRDLDREFSRETGAVFLPAWPIPVHALFALVHLLVAIGSVILSIFVYASPL